MRYALARTLVVALLLLSVGVVDAALAPVIPSPRTVGSPLALTIEDSGATSIEGARITQITGTTIFAAQYWNTLPVRWVIRTNEKTKYTHRFGNPIVFSQLSVGDFLSIEGEFNGSSDALGVDARSIKNWSVSTEGSSFEGKVASAPDSSGAFILTLGDGNTVLVKPKPGASVFRGVVRTNAIDVREGDRITEVTGVYDHLNRSLAADSVKIFQDTKKFAPRNFEGTLVRLDSTTLPTTLTARVGAQEYTVYLNDKAMVLRKNRSKAMLERFVAGDSIRFFGSIREAEWSAVDAEVLRTLEF